MANKFILLAGLFLLNSYALYSQRNKPTQELTTLDNSFFKWKDFAFNQPWGKVKDKCGIKKIETYTDEYLNFYCGDISDTTKSYLLQGSAYHEFNNILFDQVVLHISGTTTTSFNYNSLFFIKQFSDSTKAKRAYRDILQSLKSKYGNSHTEHLEKFKEVVRDSTTESTLADNNSTYIYVYLDEKNPFSAVDGTEWWGNNNIHLKLHYIQESSLIILTVDESPFQTYWGNASNWFKESEYDEQFTAAFKEFDSKNGYKGLKFGMLKTAVNNIVKYKAPDILKQYSVINAEYKNWFYIPFQDCKITFNKKNKLYSVTLSKDDYSNIDYDQFLKELIVLFGEPKIYKEKRGDDEFTNWQGKNIRLSIIRPNDQSIYVSLSSFLFDDYSPTDKLY